MSIPPGFFSDVTRGFYGAVSPGTSEQVWKEFLAQQGVSQVEDTVESRTKYMSFLSKKLGDINESTAVNALSPNEIAGRHLVVTVFDLILVMLTSLAVEQLKNSDTLSFLAKYQQKYADLMRRAPTYIGTGYLSQRMMDDWNMSPTDNIPTKSFSTADSYFSKTSPSTIASEFKLGYADLSLEDVFRYLFNEVSGFSTTIDSNTQQPQAFTDRTFQMSSTYYPIVVSNNAYIAQNFWFLNIKKQTVDGKEQLVLSATLNVQLKWSMSGGVASYTKTATRTIPVGDETNTISQFNSAFQEVYQDAKANRYVEATLTQDEKDFWAFRFSPKYTYFLDYPVRDTMIPWPSGILMSNVEQGLDTNPQQNLNNILAYWIKSRAQENKLMSSYIEGLKGKKNIYKDKYDQVSQVGESGRTSRSQTVSFLQAFLRQLQNMLSSIFR